MRFHPTLTLQRPCRSPRNSATAAGARAGAGAASAVARACAASARARASAAGARARARSGPAARLHGLYFHDARWHQRRQHQFAGHLRQPLLDAPGHGVHAATSAAWVLKSGVLSQLWEPHNDGLGRGLGESLGWTCILGFHPARWLEAQQGPSAQQSCHAAPAAARSLGFRGFLG